MRDSRQYGTEGFKAICYRRIQGNKAIWYRGILGNMVTRVARGVMFGGSHDVRNVNLWKCYTLEKIRMEVTGGDKKGD